MEPENHPFEKENPLPSTSILRFKLLVFEGLVPVPKVSLHQLLAGFWDQVTRSSNERFRPSWRKVPRNKDMLGRTATAWPVKFVACQAWDFQYVHSPIETSKKNLRRFLDVLGTCIDWLCLMV